MQIHNKNLQGWKFFFFDSLEILKSCLNMKKGLHKNLFYKLSWRVNKKNLMKKNEKEKQSNQITNNIIHDLD